MSLGILTALFLIMALLYSSVGQGGGSGYLAAMALMGVAPENIRQTALVLNIVVAAIGLVSGSVRVPTVYSSVGVTPVSSAPSVKVM